MEQLEQFPQVGGMDLSPKVTVTMLIPPLKQQIRQKTVMIMKIMALYRDYGIFCGAFNHPENLVKCILETLDQWEVKDISIALHPHFFRAYSHSRSTTFLVRELEVDTGDIHGIDITNGILPTIVPLFKERGWEVCDYRRSDI